jgi:hypothetical protein
VGWFSIAPRTNEREVREGGLRAVAAASSLAFFAAIVRVELQKLT